MQEHKSIAEQQEMDIKIFQKFEISTERGLAKACEICKSEFGVFAREHQCKRCLRAICADCGTTKRDVYKFKMTKRPHRLCVHCKSQSDLLIKYINTNQLKFGENSEIGNKWYKKLPEPIKADNGMKLPKQHKFTYEIFTEVWDAYNYSVREFIGLLTFSSNQQDIYKQINSVFQELQSRGIDQKMQYSIFLIAFMLCFTSVSVCCDLIEFIYSLKKTVSDPKQLLQLYLKALAVKQSDMKKLTDYFNYKLKIYMGSISVNVVTAECSIHVITRILQKKKIDEAYMFFSLVIEKNCEFLIQNKGSKLQCDMQIIRSCNLDEFLDKYRLLTSVKSGLFIISARSMSSNNIALDNNLPLESEEIKSQRGANDEEEIKFMMKKKKTSIDYEADYDAESMDNFSQSSNSPIKIKKNISALIKDENESEIKMNKSSTMTENLMASNSAVCQQCSHKQERIKQLESKLQQKQQQIVKLNLKINFTSREFEEEERAVRNRNQTQSHVENAQITKLERQILDKSEQNESIFRELNKYQKQNLNLKSEIEELNTNNKMLKNRLESVSMHAQSATSTFKSTQKDEENGRVKEMLEKKLVEKNKQLEELMKKNKMLTYQIETLEVKSRQQERKSDDSSALDMQKQNKLLKDKNQQLSTLLMKQEAEKLEISNELFEFKENWKESRGRMTEGRKGEEGGRDCQIF